MQCTSLAECAGPEFSYLFGLGEAPGDTETRAARLQALPSATGST